MSCDALTKSGKKCTRNGVIEIGKVKLCTQHLNQVLNEKNDAYLVHATHVENLESILSMGGIATIKEVGRRTNFSVEELSEMENSFISKEAFEKYKNSVFMAVAFHTKGEEFMFRPDKTGKKEYAYFIYDISLMEEYDNHWCNGWRYGILNKEDCFVYDRNKTKEQNVNLWRKRYEYRLSRLSPIGETFGVESNEVVFDLSNKKPQIINFDKLVHLYIDSKNYKFEEVTKLVEGQPELPWVFENPLRSYSVSNEEIQKWLEMYVYPALPEDYEVVLIKK